MHAELELKATREWPLRRLGMSLASSVFLPIISLAWSSTLLLTEVIQRGFLIHSSVETWAAYLRHSSRFAPVPVGVDAMDEYMRLRTKGGKSSIHRCIPPSSLRPSRYSTCAPLSSLLLLLPSRPLCRRSPLLRTMLLLHLAPPVVSVLT
jgi:hypothetical protein